MAESVYDLVPTQVGAKLVSEILAKGATLDMTKIEMGDGFLPAGKTESQMIALSNAKVSFPVTRVQELTNNTGILVEGVFTNADIDTEFFYREVGFYGKAKYVDGAYGAETLISYGNAGDAAELLKPQGGSQVRTKRITNNILLSGRVNVSMTVTDGLSATKEDLDQVIESVTNLTQVVAEKIPASQKGAVGGVAELDSAGKVPVAQLPALGLTEADVQNLINAGKDVVFSNVAVPASSWTATSAYTYAKYQATVSLAGVTSAMDAEVFFSANDADSGMFSGGGVVNNGSITLLAIKQPTANITIPKIRFMKGA